MSLKNPKIKKMNLFVRIITFGWPGAITLAPFGIYIRERYFEWNNEYHRTNKTPAYYTWCGIVQHEKIHWKQQLSLLIIFFYPWYLIEWLIRILTPPWNTAYVDISMEMEANDFEYVPGYLEIRKPFAYLKYIGKSQKQKKLNTMKETAKENLRAFGFDKEVADVEGGKCPFCRSSETKKDDFRDKKSFKEFQISGLCQKCQDDFFGA